MAADCFFENFIKAAETAKRNSETKMIINPPKSNVPGDFSKFLLNGGSKTLIIELLFQTIKEKILHVLNTTDDLLT